MKNRIKKLWDDHSETAISFAVGFAIVSAFKLGQMNGLSQNRIAKAEKYSHTDGRQCIELTFRNGKHQDILWKDRKYGPDHQNVNV